MLASGAITVVLYSSSTVTNSILQGLDRLTAPAKNALISLGIHLVAAGCFQMGDLFSRIQ